MSRKQALAQPRCARSAAVRVLERVDAGEASQAALDAVLTAAALDAREAALCTELVYGYLRTRLRLEAVLAAVLPRPQSLPARLRILLALAVYALLFLERVPDHATVHWTVEAARAHFGQRLAGLANAALRAVLRLGTAPQEPAFYAAKGDTPLDALARYYAMPLWIARLWEGAYGAQTASMLLRRAFERPVPALRLNARHSEYVGLRAALLEAGAQAIAQHGVAFVGAHPPSFVCGRPLAQWIAEGACSWQSAGSQCALQAVDAWRAPVWDACAGQGGKALACLEAGVPVALCSDVSMARLRLLMQGAARLGLPCPPHVCASVLTPPISPWEGTILLDAPCSGFGTLARRPEIRTRMTQERVFELARLQSHMLDAAWQCLVPGGQVVYMTCTINPAENEGQVDAFCQRHADAHVHAQWATPHEHPWIEGMFVAALCKR